jgi:hypothetical protein
MGILHLVLFTNYYGASMQALVSTALEPLVSVSVSNDALHVGFAANAPNIMSISIGDCVRR